jgi:hypothetical protein
LIHTHGTMPRLDPKGYLLEEPGEEETDIAWIGESSGSKMTKVDEEEQEVQVTCFASVMVGDNLITVGDCVYLTPESKGDPCEVGCVKGMFEVDSTGEKHFELQWFWRPEHIVVVRDATQHRKSWRRMQAAFFALPSASASALFSLSLFLSRARLLCSPGPCHHRLPHPSTPSVLRSFSDAGAQPKHMQVDDREIFVSAMLDSNPIEAFEARVTVKQLRESDPIPPPAPHTFFYRRHYDVAHQNFTIAPGSEPAVARTSSAPAAVQSKAAAAPASHAAKQSGASTKAAAAAGAPPLAATAAGASARHAAGEGAQDDKKPPAPRKRKSSETGAALPPAGVPKAPKTGGGSSSGASGKGAGGSTTSAAAITHGSSSAAARRLQEQFSKVKAKSREVQRDMTKLLAATPRELLECINCARERHADLIKVIDDLDELIAPVSQRLLDQGEGSSGR